VSSSSRIARSVSAGAVAVVALLGLGAQPAAGIRWAWSGAVTARSAVVKARASRGGVRVRLELARAGGAPAATERFEAQADADGIASFDLARLDPATRYEYRAGTEGAGALAGTFRTFGEGPWSFRIAVSACAETGSASPVFDTIRNARPDLFVHAGDIHYEDITRNDPERFRRTFDAVMASLTQSRLYRSVPIAYTWDDHDFGGNASDASSAARPAALAVYRQFVPHYPLQAGALAAISQSFTIGRVRVIMTDSRSQRTSSWRAPQTRTLLGAAQLKWLKDELSAAASAPLVIWVNAVPWIASEGPGSDNWGSYPLEREVVANHIDSLGLARRILMLSGDAHMVAIDDGTHSNYATGAGRGSRGFVVMHAAPLDRRTSMKGGPYSHGVSRQRGQFGLVDVADDGRTLKVELSGRDLTGALIKGMRLAVVCEEKECRVAR
jgi:phosphodiesterase/alkaline phosphatase D-like protein